MFEFIFGVDIIKKRKSKASTKLVKKIIVSLYLIATIVLLFLICNKLSSLIMPTVVKTVEMQSTSVINETIAKNISNKINTMNLNSNDFYSKTESNGKITSISIDTILVNNFCASLSSDVSKSLSNASSTYVSIPIGSFFGIQALSDFGAPIKIKIHPIGNSVIDYETSFTSSGINQTNFQVWLNVKSTIKIVNPLQDSEVILTRKVPLVNTIINGEIPATYLNTDSKNSSISPFDGVSIVK